MSYTIRTRKPQFRIVTSAPARRLCSECTHGYVGDDGVLCRLLNEMISNERTAESCELYESEER